VLTGALVLGDALISVDGWLLIATVPVAGVQVAITGTTPAPLAFRARLLLLLVALPLYAVPLVLLPFMLLFELDEADEPGNVLDASAVASSVVSDFAA
jgi:hypothetical protein